MGWRQLGSQYSSYSDKDISATDVEMRIIFFKEVMNLIYKIY